MNCGLVIRNAQNCNKIGQSIKSALFSRKIITNIKLCEYAASTLSATNLTSKGYLLTVDYQSRLKTTKLFNKRCYSEESGPPANRLPPLMDFPRLVWPSLFKSFRNFILATFIIRPYLDKDFTLPDFVAGSKKAVEVVSNKLSTGDLKSLEGLVTSDILPTIQRAVSLMSLSQREQLAVNVDDIYFSFPYQIGIIFGDESESDQKRTVEVTMVYHCLHGLAAMRERGEEPPLNMGMLPEYQQRLSICNYRFTREYRKGSADSDWSINALNHFKPVDDE